MQVDKNLKINIEVKETYIKVTNLLDRVIENCLLDVKNVLYGTVISSKFNLEPNESKDFYFLIDNFYEEWRFEKLHVKLYSNHKKIIDRHYNDKSKCFVVLTNKKFESLVEQLIIGLTKYTDIDILHYCIGYKSNLYFPNLINIEFGIGEDVNDPHYMQFSKAPVFIDVLNKGYKSAIFLDADIQVRPNISDIISLTNEIEDGPIFQKGAHDYTVVGKHYVPGPMVQDLLDLPRQKFPHGITNVVIFNQDHRDLIQQWHDVCFSDKIKEIKKVEFLHDELLLNCLMWKNNIKPKYYWFGLNIENLDDVKFFYNYNNTNFDDRVDMNDFELGHQFQSFIPYDKNQILFFHCVKDVNLAKNINDYISEREEGDFKTRLVSFYKDIKLNHQRISEDNLNKVEIINHYIDGPYVEILASEERNFLVKFYDGKMNVIHEANLKSNMWTRCNRKYFDYYSVEVYESGSLIYHNAIDLENKRVLLAIESSSLGDSLAWMPYAEEFRKKHNCKVVLSTFMNDLFQDHYPDIEFLNPGTVAHNLYAAFRIGWYYDDKLEIDYSRVPQNFRMQPMQKTASDILGLEFKEIKPKITIPKVIKEKRVGIAIHATAQSKYWNNPTGWQEVVNYLISLGYKVTLYSKEGDGFMGNHHPKGIEKFKGGSISEVINDLAKCEFFVGIGSGLSWLSWAVNLPTIIVSGFSYDYTETVSNTWRVINNNVCTGCFNRHRLDPADWNWCPDYKETPKQFECSKQITSEMVINTINQVIQTI
jgi:autotransporter strand-loop-strand O-heptosyltransferase